MRRLISGSVAALVLLAIGLSAFVYTFYQRITHYPRAPLAVNETPADFGYATYSTESYPSLYDGIPLEGWFIPSKDSLTDRALVLVHGRGSNRNIELHRYADLFHELALDSTYHLFIPDARNSGASSEAATAMGYEFAEDIYSGLRHVQATYALDRFVLYSLSMGAIGTATMLDRPDLQAERARDGIIIERLLFDSPISNVRGILYYSAAAMGLPDALTSLVYTTFNHAHDGYIDRMALGTLLPPLSPMPILILQGDADTLTPVDVFRAETDAFTPNIAWHIYPGSDHVNLQNNPAHRADYTARVGAFLLDQSASE